MRSREFIHDVTCQGQNMDECLDWYVNRIPWEDKCAAMRCLVEQSVTGQRVPAPRVCLAAEQMEADPVTCLYLLGYCPDTHEDLLLSGKSRWKPVNKQHEAARFLSGAARYQCST